MILVLKLLSRRVKKFEYWYCDWSFDQKLPEYWYRDQRNCLSIERGREGNCLSIEIDRTQQEITWVLKSIERDAPQCLSINAIDWSTRWNCMTIDLVITIEIAWVLISLLRSSNVAWVLISRQKKSVQTLLEYWQRQLMYSWKIVRKIVTVALHSVNKRPILDTWYVLPSKPDGRTYKK